VSAKNTETFNSFSVGLQKNYVRRFFPIVPPHITKFFYFHATPAQSNAPTHARDAATPKTPETPPYTVATCRRPCPTSPVARARRHRARSAPDAAGRRPVWPLMPCSAFSDCRPTRPSPACARSTSMPLAASWPGLRRPPRPPSYSPTRPPPARAWSTPTPLAAA
jgi:hypothetical protein